MALKGLNVALPGLLTLFDVNPSQEVVLKEQLLDGQPLGIVAFKAALDKVAELVGPLVWNFGNVHVNDVVDEVFSLANPGERRHSSRQLVCKAAEGPNIDLFRVLSTFGDLWRDPIRCALFGLSPCLLL